MDNKYTRVNPWNFRRLLVAVLGLVTVAAFALDSVEPDLLKPDQAFRFSAGIENDSTARVTWDIADGYYLYRDRIRFSTDTPGIELGEAGLPAGEIKNDEFFGKLAVYRKQALVTIPFTRTPDAPAILNLTAVSQGCADIGVCFPPHTQVAQLDIPPPSSAARSGAIAALETLGGKLGLGAGGEEDFLEPDEAFRVSVTAEQPDLLLIRWDIADGYYLYRDKFKAQLVEGGNISLGSPTLPPGETKHDEFFGDVQIFHQEAEMRLPLLRPATDATDITLQVTYQGCAEAGICYPPIKKSLPVTLAAVDAMDRPPASAARAGGRSVAPSVAPPSPSGVTSRQDDIARVLQEGSAGWIVLFFFGAGMLLLGF